MWSYELYWLICGVYNNVEEATESIGGDIHEITWDESNERLAVSFQCMYSNPLTALFTSCLCPPTGKMVAIYGVFLSRKHSHTDIDLLNMMPA